MVARRRKKKKTPLLPVRDLRCCSDSILQRSAPGVWCPPPSTSSISPWLPLAPPVFSSDLQAIVFLGLSYSVVCSYLAALSCRPHPVCTAAGQTLFLRDAKDISQAITFSAWVRYLYNWILPDAEVLGRHNERGKDKKRRRGERARRRPNKVQVPFPPGPH